MEASRLRMDLLLHAWECVGGVTKVKNNQHNPFHHHHPPKNQNKPKPKNLNHKKTSHQKPAKKKKCHRYCNTLFSFLEVL